MKRLLIVLGLCLGFVARGQSATQPHNIGNVKASSATFTGAITLGSRTIAQLNQLTSDATGQLIVCSDCTQSVICVSSGTVSKGSWVIAVATGTFAGATYSGLAHCQ